eukprot:15291143-Heterocapsa_arctica.AAC.1
MDGRQSGEEGGGGNGIRQEPDQGQEGHYEQATGPDEHEDLGRGGRQSPGSQALLEANGKGEDAFE